MIRYALSCDAGHGFESWFASADGFAALQASGQVNCPLCGSARVEKALMAPTVRPAREPAPKVAPALAGPLSEVEAAIAALRRHIETTSEYVGMNFAAEARRMHGGEAPERPIHGETAPDEARKLIEEGLPVAPLPFLPRRKVN